MADDTKMNLASIDVAEEKRQQLKQLFPEVFAEDKVDFEALRRVLGDLVDADKERFGLNWPGKADCMKVIQAPSVATLKPCREESVNFDETENLFIEGDNLEVLKLLQKSYFGKIKMIYIDPPYNTGNEFIYPDNYAENLDTYLAYTGQADDEGRKFSTNSEAVGRFHSNWLNMMYPRLYLARNLLHEDGTIFVSIDDNEQATLRHLCDFVFGEENFVATFVWKSRQNKDNRPEKGASIDHEYVLCYGRRVRGDERKTEQYSNPDDDPRGPWTSANMVGLATKERRPNLHFDLTNPDTGTNYGCPDMGWRYNRKTMAWLISENRILWPSSLEGRPRRKAFFSELTSEFTGISSLIGDGVFTRDGTAEVKSLFGFRAMDFPKPVQLMRQLIDQAVGEDGIILDFFSGSCTTAHAVMELNQKDEVGRRFIMVQLPEPTNKDSEAARSGLHTIADIGKERIRRAARSIEKENSEELSLKQNEALDLGFKVLKLDRSNFKIWEGDAELFDESGEQLEMHVDHVSKEASAEDILYELLLKAGFELTTKIEKRTIAGMDVFSIAEGALLICLEKEVTAELIDALAEADPIQVICLDEAFKGNDQLKANAVQTFASRAAAQESEIVFRTV